jgi:hypothetical protein
MADVSDRERGKNPMSEEYIERVRLKRESMGVSQLSENGYPVSNDTRVLCRKEAEKITYSDIGLKRPPSKTCILCGKTIEEVGGRRMIAQKFIGVTLSDKYSGGGNPDYTHQSVKLYDDGNTYVTMWGGKDLWTADRIDSAHKEYLTGHSPWFCQICGRRACSKCGAPVNMPVASDVLYSNGETDHVPIIPADLGCINPKCPKYREMSGYDINPFAGNTRP